MVRAVNPLILEGIRQPRAPLAALLDSIREQREKEKANQQLDAKLAIDAMRATRAGGVKGSLKPEDRILEALTRKEMGEATPEDEARVSAWMKMGGVGVTPRGDTYFKRALDLPDIATQSAAASAPAGRPTASTASAASVEAVGAPAQGKEAFAGNLRSETLGEIDNYARLLTKAKKAGYGTGADTSFLDRVGTGAGDILFDISPSLLGAVSPEGRKLRESAGKIAEKATLEAITALDLPAQLFNNLAEREALRNAVFSPKTTEEGRQRYIMDLMKRYGITREQALGYIAHAATDEGQAQRSNTIRVDKQGNVVQ